MVAAVRVHKAGGPEVLKFEDVDLPAPGPGQIRVNAVAPGLIATDIHPPGRLDRLAPMMPIARAGTAEEVAPAIMFLLSDASSYTTGTILRVSGGR